MVSTEDEPPDQDLYEAIGPWTEVKHEIIRKYAKAYSTILSKQQRPRLDHVYIDAFAGAGRYLSRKSGLLVPGSTESALEIDPPFHEYHFIDIHDVKVSRLERIARDRSDVSVYHGDCNQVLVEQVLPPIRWDRYRRGLCLLDPYGLDLNWTTVQSAAVMRTIEIFINFPTMDINRNVLRRDPSSIDSVQAERMTAFWGDESWRESFYQPRSQLDLWGEQRDEKAVGNEGVAQAYRERLRTDAGFKYVPPPLPMKNSSNATLYYLFFASHKAVAGDIVEQIFDKYRAGGQTRG